MFAGYPHCCRPGCQSGRSISRILLQSWLIATLIAILIACSGSGVFAAEFRQMRLADGTELDYAVVLPADFRSDRNYPALLAFPGGRQNLESVRGGLSRFWENEAARRDYLVFSPVAPAGKPFYEAGADLIPLFLEQLLASFRIEGGKFHVAGLSNGGVSAFVAAIRYPQMFHSLTALAGFPVESADFEHLDRLRGIRVSMFVGDGDLYWKEGMEKTRDRLAALGIPVYFEVLPRNGHFLPDLSFERSGRVFDRIGR